MTSCGEKEYREWLTYRTHAKAAESRRQTVVLTPERLTQAVALAKARNGKERSLGPMTYGARLTGLQAHLVGILGEQAVAQHYGLAVDTAIHQRHGDEGIDLTIPCLGRTGVKTTTYLDDPLLRVEVDHSVADYFILACVPDVASKPEQVYLCGYTTRENLLAEGRRVQLVHGGPVNLVMSEMELSQLPGAVGNAVAGP